MKKSEKAASAPSATHELAAAVHLDMGLVTGERLECDLEAGPLSLDGEPLEHLINTGLAVPIGGAPEAPAPETEVPAAATETTEGGSHATE